MKIDISTRSIFKNSILNLIGLASPLFVAIITIPIIIGHLGIERFGFLTIAWAMVGYFGLFDIGLSRALTHLISKTIATGRLDDIPSFIWTSLSTMLILGIIGSVVVFLLSDVLVTKILIVSEGLHEEFIHSIRVLTLSIPIVIISTGLKGVLEAYQRFANTNMIQLLIGFSNFISPLVVLLFSNSLVYIILLMFVTRALSLLLYLYYTKLIIPHLFRQISVRLDILRSLLSFGGWVSVSTIIGPVMVYFDRFIIGTFISVSIVAYYTTPYEIISRVTLISVAISGALFPTLSSVLCVDNHKAIELFDRALRYVTITVFPVILLVITFAQNALHIWLGSNFAHESTPILQCLALGVFINCVAFIPFAFIQASNRPDITAKIHLFELPIYLFALSMLVKSIGIFGAAVAWTLRVTIDAGLLIFATNKISPMTSQVILRMLFWVFICVLFFVVGIFVSGRFLSWFFATITVLCFFLVSWLFILKQDERLFIKNKILRCMH
ncbi:MAG: flippase [Thermodesulfovibrionales bacterium]